MTKTEELSDLNSCLNKARDDELMFVLLERDPTAPCVIREWIKARIKFGLNKHGDPKLMAAERIADDIERKLMMGKQ